MLARLVDVSVLYSSSGFANLYDMYSSFGGLCLCVVTYVFFYFIFLTV